MTVDIIPLSVFRPYPSSEYGVTIWLHRVADGLEKLVPNPIQTPLERFGVYWNTIYKVARWEHPDTRIWTVHFEGMT